ncbi:MAG: hypothetical protein HKN82_05010 [Akkermansiaceae bacterium]|nr:hypothetical protein [Akkermansiaceae bacterium]
MAPDALHDLTRFQWEPCPQGQRIVDDLIDEFLSHSPEGRDLAGAMKDRAGTRFLDWLDHLVTPREHLVADLEAAGFTPGGEHDGRRIFEHHGAIFPRILVKAGVARAAAVKVDSVADFLATHTLPVDIEGPPHGILRRARAWARPEAELWVVERHGHRGFEVPPVDPAAAVAAQEHRDAFRRRPRDFPNDDEAFEAIHGLLDASIATLGRDWTADLWFAAEREFWMRRNRAARVQKARQDALGLGWANHDHHTYRCRRATFERVIAVFEKLGCTCRERFYAGAAAGWGAQVLEQPATGIVIFADVDMDSSEVTGDFAHLGFPDREELGTVGLWCELHGESILEAGMHHLECQFDFDSLRDQMQAEAGISMMKPFTDFDFLRQQFTEGERWAIRPERIERLLRRGQITAGEAEQFRTGGAIGSHLENLERNDGFKGFNQTGINEIILATDPRRQPGPTRVKSA